MKYFLLLLLMACASHSPKEQAYLDLKDYFAEGPIHRFELAPEGQYIAVFNPRLTPFITKKLKHDDLIQLKKMLTPSMQINLTPRGFAKAAERNIEPGKKDDTNYDAIWVRDSGWIYLALIESGQAEKASKLINALWDYYASEAQLKRIEKIIANPKLSREGTMHVPHIRFNGNSPSFEDVFLNGEPQVWNHRQNDAHGIFLYALADAIERSLVSLNGKSPLHKKVIRLFPSYFDKIQYHQYPGAGAWEEVSKINTSSIAMVVRALETWIKLPRHKRGPWEERLTKRLIRLGYQTIKRQLKLGGEATDQMVNSVEFRREDAALFNLFLPHPLPGLSAGEKQLALLQIEKLIRPFGVLRYENDSYQSGNYWVQEPGASQVQAPSETGDSSSVDDFLNRFKKFKPGSEAQWFFDSKLAMIYLQLAKESKDAQAKGIYRHYGVIHFKRALGQVTGTQRGGIILAADGKRVRALQFPESINTILFGNERFYLPSPITPLNWAKASALMMMERYQAADFFK